MVERKIQRKISDNKDTIYVTILLSTFVGMGFILGRRYQKNITKQILKDTNILRKLTDPMFPDTMSIAEIKEAISQIPGAEFQDAIVTLVDGARHLYIR